MSVPQAETLHEKSAAVERRSFRATNPRSGAPTGETYYEATAEEVGEAATAAAAASHWLAELSASAVADLLEAIRQEILQLGEALIAQADEETGLGVARLTGERDRTTNQLKLFADLVREGSWVDARIDTPQPDRKPVPKPDLRRMLEPIGPIAVFGASNFPLAFSVAGGDTAAALAARNPVIVKAHPAHPATSDLVAGAIKRAVESQSLPPGTFSMLHGGDPAVSVALVTHPAVKAVGFTGSERAGRALYDAASKRPEPIPVFSEMGSVNPVFLLPDVTAERAERTADGLFASVTASVGQMCTVPGLVFAIEDNGFDAFLTRLRQQFEGGTPATMLNRSIAEAYARGFEQAASGDGMEQQLSLGQSDPAKTEGRPGLLITAARHWLARAELRKEIFGPSTIVVRCADTDEMLECAEALEGSLTATVHGTPAELAGQKRLIAILRRKAGRLIFNGYPTGVEVGYAMQHGGPYPASTDSRFTSVGTASIFRFARPVCYQNFPPEQLPEELQDANPRRIWRMVNGQMTKDPLHR